MNCTCLVEQHSELRDQHSGELFINLGEDRRGLRSKLRITVGSQTLSPRFTAVTQILHGWRAVAVALPWQEDTNPRRKGGSFTWAKQLGFEAPALYVCRLCCLHLSHLRVNLSMLSSMFKYVQVLFAFYSLYSPSYSS